MKLIIFLLVQTFMVNALCSQDTVLLRSGAISKSEDKVFYIYDGFENSSQKNSFNSQLWSKQVPSSSSNGIEVVKNIKRNGLSSLRFNFKLKDWNTNSANTFNLRTEIMLKDQNLPENKISLNKDHWIGLSQLLPKSWIADYDENPELIWQFHGSFNSPGGSGSPPLGAFIYGDSLKIIAHIGNAHLNNVNGTEKVLLTIKTPIGNWIDWVIMVNFSYDDGGKVKIWKNRELILDYQGQTLYHPFPIETKNDGPYFKTGIYKWNWGKTRSQVTERMIYVDDIRIGNDSSSFQIKSPQLYKFK